MKIRNGFVSNSSSSSFVVVVTGEAETCPCCGHAPESIVDMLMDGNRGGYYGDDSSVEEIGDYLDELEYERNQIASRITKLEQRDPEEVTYPQYRDCTKVKQSLEWSKEELADIVARIDKLQQLVKEGKKVYRLEIESYDGLAQRIFDENVERGIVTVIEGED